MVCKALRSPRKACTSERRLVISELADASLSCSARRPFWNCAWSLLVSATFWLSSLTMVCKALRSLWRSETCCSNSCMLGTAESFNSRVSISFIAPWYKTTPTRIETNSRTPQIKCGMRTMGSSTGVNSSDCGVVTVDRSCSGRGDEAWSSSGSCWVSGWAWSNWSGSTACTISGSLPANHAAAFDVKW